MFEDTRPAALASDGRPDPWGEFRVDDPAEVLHWLRQLRDGSVPVNLVSPQGDTIGTRIWSLDDLHGQISFAADDSGAHLPRLTQGDEATAVAYLDHVKLQFELDQLVLVRGHGHCALRARLPQQLWRFQRRASYRVRLPERQPPQAQLRHPSIPDMRLALRIVDLGNGGCALALPDEVPELQPGSTLHDVRIALDADTQFTTTLRLQHVSAMHGGSGRRLGCAFADLDGAAQRMLQRYIDRTQQRRRLLAGR